MAAPFWRRFVRFGRIFFDSGQIPPGGGGICFWFWGFFGVAGWWGDGVYWGCWDYVVWMGEGWMEEISLLVHRIGGRMFQVLADEGALYVVYLGDMRSRAALRRSVVDPVEFVAGRGVERIRKADADYVRVLLGLSLTEISLHMLDGTEFVWHMNCWVPEEEVRRLFSGIRLHLGALPEERELVDVDPEDAPEGFYDGMRIRREFFGTPAEESENDDDVPPAPGLEVLIEWGTGALSVLFTALWWLNQSVLVFALNLLLLPAAIVLLGLKQGERLGRFTPGKLFWLLPGLGMRLLNVRINVVDKAAILLPAAVIAVILALLYAVLCGKRLSWRKVVGVLVLCLLTYGPGAALSLNTLRTEEIRIARVDPVLIRPNWVDVRLDGVVRRMHAPPQVTGTLSSAGWCELRMYRGMMGIEYWTVIPGNLPDAV